METVVSYFTGRSWTSVMWIYFYELMSLAGTLVVCSPSLRALPLSLTVHSSSHKAVLGREGSSFLLSWHFTKSSNGHLSLPQSSSTIQGLRISPFLLPHFKERVTFNGKEQDEQKPMPARRSVAWAGNGRGLTRRGCSGRSWTSNEGLHHLCGKSVFPPLAHGLLLSVCQLNNTSFRLASYQCSAAHRYAQSLLFFL